MITYYQPLSRSFFQPKPDIVPIGIKRYYYTSFEDGLWDLLQKKNVPASSVILVPSFYCMDVVENIRTHGYTPTFYDVGRYFQTSATHLLQAISLHKPAVIILFHACGISLKIAQQKDLMRRIAKKALVIEDSVHRLIQPSSVKLMHNNHYVIDSLRKVSPLPGSFLYGTTKGLSFQQTCQTIGLYPFAGWLLYLLFRTTFELGYHLRSATILSFAHERVLKLHDDLIGNHLHGYKGLPVIPALHKHFRFSEIEEKKYKQVLLYEKTLFATTPHNSVYRIAIEENDFQKLHVYPVGLKKKSKKLLRALQKIGVVAWYKFDDCPWSKQQSVLFLPLGLHVKNEDIIASASVIRRYAEQ